ncbi:MAG TPA: recombinase family protein [Bryobacteraceae bacterium]|nr:recombinase family protein [Bryobacteraceae bacterium]
MWNRGRVLAPEDGPRTDARSAVLYARVSSKEQELGYSIAAQQELMRSYASRVGLTVEKEFVDVESAKTTGRQAFLAMVDYLQQHRACRVVLAEKTDRLYRNLKDYVTMDDLDVEIHFVKESEVLSKSSRSAQKFMHGIRVLMAKNYIDNLSEEVRKGLHTKAAQKMWPSFAPLGYLNVVSETGKRIIVPDPILGPIVTRLFEWFASGEYSLKSLARKAYDEGFRFRKSRNKVPVTTLHKILRKRIYTGDFDYAGVTYRGSHEPLVTRGGWERVQNILDGRHTWAGKGMHTFMFSGIVRCGHCGCSLVGELKKCRYVYYHCTGYRGRCGEPYVREENLKQQFSQRLRALVIPSEILEWLNTELLPCDQTEEAARRQTARRYQAELERSRNRLNLLYEDRLQGRITAAMYDERAEVAKRDEQQIQERIRILNTASLPSLGQAIDLMAHASNAATQFAEAPLAHQRDLLRLVLKDASWKGRELRMSLKEPFEKLALSNSESANVSMGLRGKEPNFDIWR